MTLHYAGEEEFAHFVCIAKNKVGWDALTFNVHREKGNLIKETELTTLQQIVIHKVTFGFGPYYMTYSIFSLYTMQKSIGFPTHSYWLTWR